MSLLKALPPLTEMAENVRLPSMPIPNELMVWVSFISARPMTPLRNSCSDFTRSSVRPFSSSK